jgi:hypothetical protein
VQTITIPERYASGLAKVKNLSESDVQEVVLALERAATGTRKEILSLVSPALPSFSSNDTREIVETLRSLYRAQIGMDVPVEQFVPGLIAAVSQSDNRELQTTDPSELVRLEGTLKKLLGVRRLWMVSKARDLQTEYESTFCDARIVTDMRPVFDADVKESPVGFALTHSLKLEYHHHDEHTAIYISMDKGDIETLLLVLERAKQKASTLSELAASCKLPILSE